MQYKKGCNPASHFSRPILTKSSRASSRVLAVFAFLLSSWFSPVGASGPEQHVTFGGDSIYPPFEWVEDGRLHGFNIALEQALAYSGGVDAEHRLDNWPETIRALESGDVDIVPMFRSDSRETKFWFSKPFYELHHALYADAASERSPALTDLANLRVSVEEGSYAHERLQEAEPAARLVLAENTHDALQRIVRGEASYAILATPTADYLIARHAMPLKRVGAPIWSREYAFAVLQDRPEMAAWVSENLSAVVGSGEYQRLLDEWSKTLWLEAGASTPFGWKEDVPMYLSLGAIVTALVCLLIADRRNRFEPTTLLPSRARFIKAAERARPSLMQLGEAHCVVIRLMGLNGLRPDAGTSARRMVVREVARRLKASNQIIAAGALDHETLVFISDGMQRQEVLDQIMRPFPVNGEAVTISTCCGVSRWPEQASEIADLVHKSDAAMQASRSRGRAMMIYNRSIEPTASDRQLLRDFEARPGEGLFVVYQPQLELQTGRIVAAEALVRWRHPELGIVPPSDFVPLLETAGLSAVLTEQVINHAIKCAVRLRSVGLGCQISVNVSAHDLLEADLASLFCKAMQRHGGRPQDIKVELTETATVNHPDTIRNALAALRDLGIHSSIDDFGTGYSSLSYVAELPVSELKIDRHFISQIRRNKRHLSIVRSTIALAHELGISVVAEGAEDKQTIIDLQMAGCDRVQGYGISRPLDEDIFVEFMQSRADAGAGASISRGKYALAP